MMKASPVSSTKTTRQRHRLSMYRPALIGILVITCLVLIYRPAFNSAWLYDDYPNIVNNTNVHLTEFTASNLIKTVHGRHLDQRRVSRPLSYFTFAINYYLHGTEVFGYHLVNVVIHCLTAAALFAFALIVFRNGAEAPPPGNRRFYLAFLTVALWATHPIQVTAVTYTVQRMAQLACLFSLVSMAAYLKGRLAGTTNQQVFFFVIAAISALAALASKENAGLLPLNLALCEMLIVHRSAPQKIRARTVLLLLVLLPTTVYGLLAYDVCFILNGYQYRPFTLGERLLTQPRVILQYLGQIIYPVSSQFTFLHDITISRSLTSPWTTLPAIILLVGSTGYAVTRAGKHPLLAFSWLFFIVNHAVEGSIIPLELIYEHRNYLPSTMLCLGIVVMLASIYEKTSLRHGRHALLSLAIGLFLAIQSHTTYTRNTLFADPVLLWLDNLEKSPNLSMVHNNLGTELWNREDRKLAGHFFRSAKKLNRYMNTHQSGNVDYNLGLYATYVEYNHGAALKAFQTAYKANRGYPEVWAELARCRYLTNNSDDAGRLLAQALQTWPCNHHLQYTTAFIALKENDIRRAAPILERLLKETPTDTKVLSLATAVYLKMGKLKESRHILERWAALSPSSVRTRLGLIEVYHYLGKPSAVSEIRTDLQEQVGINTVIQLLNRVQRNQKTYAYVPDRAVILPILSRGTVPRPESTGQSNKGSPER